MRIGANSHCLVYKFAVQRPIGGVGGLNKSKSCELFVCAQYETICYIGIQINEKHPPLFKTGYAVTFLLSSL